MDSRLCVKRLAAPAWRAGATLACIGVWLTYAPLAHAAGLAYIRASSQHAPTDRGRFHPLNVLDDDAGTTWCEGAAGLGEGEGISVQFKKRQRINRVTVTPAAGSGRIIQALRISDGSTSVVVDLAPTGVDLTLSRSLEGQTYEVTIERVGGPSAGAPLPADVACLADVLLFQGNQLFGGKGDKLRYDERLDRLLGRWQGGALGAPEKFLVFALDGTWEWSYRPLLSGRPRKLSGEYRFRGKRLLMRQGEVGRWSDISMKVERVLVSADDVGAPADDYDKLILDGPFSGDVLGQYVNAQFD